MALMAVGRWPLGVLLARAAVSPRRWLQQRHGLAAVTLLMRGYALVAAAGVLGALAGSPRPATVRLVASALVIGAAVCSVSGSRGRWLRLTIECLAIAVCCLAVDTPPTASGLMFGVCVLHCLSRQRRVALWSAASVLGGYVVGSVTAVLAAGGGLGELGVALSPVSGLVVACVGMQWLVQALAGQAAAQTAAQVSLAELAAVVDTTPAALLLLDDAGRLVRYNRAAEEFYGLPPYRADREPLPTPALMPGGSGDQWATVGWLFDRARGGELLRDVPVDWTRGDGRELKLLVSTATLALPGASLTGAGSTGSLPVEPKNGESRTGVLVVVSDVTDRHRLEVQLRKQAVTDELTGLPNRTLFTDRLEHAMAVRPELRGTLAVALIDLDGFKAVNDTGGHLAGDMLLHQTASRLRAAVRSGDTVGRLGGDEFAVLLEAGTREGVQAAAAALLDAMRATVPLADGTRVSVSGSIGLTVLTPGDGADAGSVLADADLAMYAAKRGGGDRVAVFDPAMRTAITERLALEAELRAALAPERIDGQIVVHYQPYIDLTSGPGVGRVVGVEALVRWVHPTRGLLAPGEFIGLAEGSGLVVPLGRHVLATAAAQARAWQLAQQRTQPDAPALTVSVNLSVRQLTDPELPALVQQVLADTGLPAHTLTLELTESVLAADDPGTVRVLQELKQLGIRLAVDDFGTGYSALSYLQRFPLDVLKVDRSFVRDLPDPKAAPLTASIIRLAESLGLTTVAEGIETAEQAAALRAMGCDTAQGFFFARPQPADQVTSLLLGDEDTARPASLPSDAVAR